MIKFKTMLSFIAYMLFLLSLCAQGQDPYLSTGKEIISKKKQKMEDLSEQLVVNVDEHEESTCLLANDFIKTIEENPSLINDHLRTGKIARDLFYIRKKLIKSLPKESLECEIRFVYNRLKYLEQELAFSSKFILQANYANINDEYDDIFSLDLLKSNAVKKANEYIPENGDLFLVRELNFSLNILPYISDEPFPFDNILVVKNTDSTEIKLATIDPLKGPTEISLNDFYQGYGSGFFEFIVLRAKENHARKELSLAFDELIVAQDKPKRRNFFYDYEYNLENKKMYAGEVIYNVLDNGAINNLKKGLKSLQNTPLNSKKNMLVKNTPGMFYTENSFLFSGLFTLEIEWTLGKAYQIEEIKKNIAPILRRKVLTSKRENFALGYAFNTIWKFRNNGVVSKVLEYYGISKLFIDLDNFDDALYLSKFYKVINICGPEIVDDIINQEKPNLSLELKSSLSALLDKCIERVIL